MPAHQTKTLPASWYRSKPLYELEQRAIFQKAWYLLGPVTRFKDHRQVTYEMAGVRFVVDNGTTATATATEPGESSNARGENPVPITWSSGQELIVSRLPDGLPLPQKLTSSGLLFAATSPSAPSFDKYFPGLEDLLARVDFTKLPFKKTLSYEGRFNWKTMIDGYQECLHCQYTHKSFSQLYPPTFYTVHNHGNYSRHFVTVPDPDHADFQDEDGLFLYFFPNCTLNVYGGGMTSFRTCPLLPSSPPPTITKGEDDERNQMKARMEFDYYHQEPADSDKFANYFQFVRRVALEDYELCEKAQENLENGVYAQGVLNPEKEGGVIHYQGLVRKAVVEQFRREEDERERRRGDDGAGKEGRGQGKVLVRVGI